ncbi:hypothetical protein GOV08_03630 [Candidatus Woesearchaeota archaeon]|nr:hypothetical protein [Candidatus Woesearchaeota archaeon]
MSKENILVFCAHSDDQIFGPGGTLAKYAKEGKDIYTYIFSYGQSTHPHLKKEVITKIRVDEAIKADKEIKGKGVRFFGITEGRFIEESIGKNLESEIINIIKRKKPSKIFTHNADEAHGDHRDVNKIVIEAFDKSNSKADLYAFDVWSPVTLAYRKNPKMVVDISKTFKIKLKALKCFKSQIVALITLLGSVYVKAIKHGLLNRHTFAEVFYKIR